MASKLPLQNSDNANVAKAPVSSRAAAGKTLVPMYLNKLQLEHILLRPDTYIGSIEKHTQTLWVYENDEMVCRSVTYVPGLYKIFDLILVNAADNKQRDPSMDSVKVVIDVEQNLISICNSGDGVPVEIHQEEGVYVPEMIFGHFLSGSSNYVDNVKKTTGGRNGYGAKITSIFSTEFIIEIADGKRLKKYKQVFENNMGKKSEPVITKCNKSENWTKVTFKPDLKKFNMTELESDVVALMSKRVFDIAGCLGKTVKVELNGERVPIKSFSDYVDLYLSAANKSRTDPLPRMTEKVNDRWEVCVSLSDGQFQQVSFVNSIATIKGGTHVDYVTSQVTNYIVDIVNKKNKNANVKPQTVKNHLWVFVNALIDNPAFDSQTKETLTLRQSSFGSKCELSEDILKNVAKSGVVENLLSWATFKQSKELKKSDGAKIMDSLPLHLLNEILFRINPRSLVMMECTNKSLQSHISNDPYFKSEYFCRLGSGILYCSSYGGNFLCYGQYSLDDPPMRTQPLSMGCLILGSCSGLLLLSLEQNYFCSGLCVANPFTKEFRFLNQPESRSVVPALPLAWRRATYIGFAVDQIDRNTQSFKIICITDEVENLEETTYRFEINDGDSWRFSETKITCSTSDLDKRMKKPVYLGGSLHWLREDGSILAFNPETEKARLIPTKFPHELSLKALFAAGDKSLTLISATEDVSYVYALENIFTDPQWVLERRIRNVVLDERRLFRWNVVAYDGMCLVLMDSYVQMLHRYDLRANRWGFKCSILGLCTANRDFFQLFNPSASYIIGLHEEKDMTLACDRESFSCNLRCIMGLVNGGILSNIVEKQFREIWAEEDKKKPILVDNTVKRRRKRRRQE